MILQAIKKKLAQRTVSPKQFKGIIISMFLFGISLMLLIHFFGNDAAEKQDFLMTKKLEESLNIFRFDSLDSLSCFDSLKMNKR